jgi:ketosteroid isomerase-like protein
MDPQRFAQRYYEYIDNGEYDSLADILAPDFVHERPDRTIEGRTRFIRFMRDERPMTETEHGIQTIFGGERQAGVEGTLVLESGEHLFGFVDIFEIEENHIRRIRTYTA